MDKTKPEERSDMKLAMLRGRRRSRSRSWEGRGKMKNKKKHQFWQPDGPRQKCRCAKRRQQSSWRIFRNLPILDDAEATPGRNDVVAIDCEMVGVGFKMESGLARCSIVDGNGAILLDTYVVPQTGVASITDYRTRYSGVRPSDMRRAVPFEEAVGQARQLLRGKLVVGHALEHDFEVLGFRARPERVRDTMRYWKLHQIASEKIRAMPKTTLKATSKKLKTLCAALLDRRIQKGEHDSVEDARAALQLYQYVAEIWEKDIISGRFKPFDVTRDRPKKSCPQCRPQRPRTESTDDASAFLDDRFWETFPENH